MTVEKSKMAPKNGHDGGMVPLAVQLEQHYTAPSPAATGYDPGLFPDSLKTGLWLGVLVGVAAGLLFAGLLDGGVLAIGGGEGLYSLAPATFYAFWAFAGAAVGLLIGGLISLFAAAPADEPLLLAAENPPPEAGDGAAEQP